LNQVSSSSSARQRPSDLCLQWNSRFPLSFTTEPWQNKLSAHGYGSVGIRRCKWLDRLSSNQQDAIFELPKYHRMANTMTSWPISCL
jgi:hypothetical protein